MRVLVIGGTLFIGKLLVRRLVDAGHDVTVAHRKAGGLPCEGVGEILADRNDTAAFQAAVRGSRFDAVFDNVYDWERGTTAEQVAGTALAIADGLSRYIFISSVAAYGSGLDRAETDPLARDDDPDDYVRNKAMSERALFELHRTRQLPVVTLRPPYIYGPGNPYYREAFFWDRMADHRPIIIPGDGQRLMQFVLVGDLVDAMMEALTNPAAVGQAFNIANQKAITQLELIASLAKTANASPKLIQVSRHSISAAGGTPLGPNLYFGFYYDMPAITQQTRKAVELLHFDATPFDEGLSLQYADYQQRPRIPQDYSFEDRLLSLP